MILLAVNFHYMTAERPAPGRAIFPMSAAAFERQLEEIGRAFEFVSRADLLAALLDGWQLPERACLITFDDGLRSQAEIALPILERLGVPAIFFVSGKPLVEGRALHVHKVHHVRESLSDQKLLALIMERLPESTIDVEAAKTMYRYDTSSSAEVKYALNVAAPVELRERLVDELFKQVCDDEPWFCRSLYMDRAWITELERRHGSIGAHGYTHRPMARLAPSALKDDIDRGARALEACTEARPRAISYPYGSADAVTPEVSKLAANAGFVLGFTMERALNRTLNSPLLFARVDTNDAPGGGRPILRLTPSGAILIDGIDEARRRYGQEMAETITRPGGYPSS